MANYGRVILKPSKTLKGQTATSYTFQVPVITSGLYFPSEPFGILMKNSFRIFFPPPSSRPPVPFFPFCCHLLTFHSTVCVIGLVEVEEDVSEK